MKKESVNFLDESILAEVNAKIEKQLQEELGNSDKQEPKIEGRIGIFGWIILVLLVILVMMKIILLMLSYLG